MKTSEIIQISTKKASVSLADKNLVRISVYENVEILKEDIVEINEAKKKLVGTSPYVVVFITPVYGSITGEARAFSATIEVYHNAIAKAIVVPNLGQRLVASFFIKFNKPPAPTKIFGTEREAIGWLKNRMEIYYN